MLKIAKLPSHYIGSYKLASVTTRVSNDTYPVVATNMTRQKRFELVKQSRRQTVITRSCVHSCAQREKV
eukprot:scaffold289204_cov71-Attheya_sp.AAC.1